MEAKEGSQRRLKVAAGERGRNGWIMSDMAVGGRFIGVVLNPENSLPAPVAKENRGE